MGRSQRVLALMLLHITVAHCFSWDIVVARSNKLEFYHEGTLAYMAAPVSHRIKWIIYDPVHDRVLFADRSNSEYSAAAFDIAKNTTKPLNKKKTSRYYKRFAYDPATELLFGTRGNKIYSFPIKSGNNNEADGNLVMDLGSAVPRELAVDSCGGYIYWTASNTIERALFNGSNREVIIDQDITVKQGLTIDSQKMYWIESQEYESGFSIESADLNGKNRRKLYSEAESDSLPDKIVVSKYFVSWMDSIDTAFFWQLPKNAPNDMDVKPTTISTASTSNFSVYGYQDIAAKYTIEERTEGVVKCRLKDLLATHSDCLDTAADELFCVNGTKVSGENRCECMQGYIGERCDVSVCHNYCYEGVCDVTDGGQPKCRCNDDYTGERCEVNICHGHCYNNGVCSLTEEDEPVCLCKTGYEGERCDVSTCNNYCFHGVCTVTTEGQPVCRCNDGHTGERCEVDACHGHCYNNGVCSLNQENEPVCQCTTGYKGERCDESTCNNYCFHGVCSVTTEGQPVCRCNDGYSGERCEVSSCHGYCLNDGTCSLNNYTEPVCQCKGQYKGGRCEVAPAISRKTYHIKFHWLPLVNGKVPLNAIIAGYEEGQNTYIARFNDNAGLLSPAKYVPKMNLAYISWAGSEHRKPKESIEVLCGSNARFVQTAEPRYLPKNAFITGHTSDGLPLYTCRIVIGAEKVLGKADPRTNKCYVPYHAYERVATSCEILVEPDDF